MLGQTLRYLTLPSPWAFLPVCYYKHDCKNITLKLYQFTLGQQQLLSWGTDTTPLLGPLHLYLTCIHNVLVFFLKDARRPLQIAQASVIQNLALGLPWWLSGEESTCQCRAQSLAQEDPTRCGGSKPGSTTTEPMLHDWRSHCSEEPSAETRE